MMISKTITIQLFATVAMFVNIAANAVDGNTASCSCDVTTNLLICEDPDDNLICFCDEDGHVYCDGEPPVREPVIIESAPVPAEALLVAPTPAPTFHTIHGCFCNNLTNVISCDDPLKEDYCFCNEDADLRCSTGTPSMEEESVHSFAISSFICDNDQVEIERDAVIRVGDSLRVCLQPQDTTSGDMISIKEITEVTCSIGMDQSFPIVPIPVQDEQDQVTSEFAFSGGGRGFKTRIKPEYTRFNTGNGEVSFTCSGSVSFSLTRRHRLESVEEAFSLSVNIANINEDAVTSGSIDIATDVGTYLVSIAIIVTGLLFL